MKSVGRSRIAAGISSFALAAGLGFLSLPASVLAHEPAEHAEAEKPAPTGIPDWSIESPDLRADPAVTFGTLENGMRYALMRNATPEGGASVRFTFNVGKKDESEAERGAAHFVEHMAFNGSTNIPEGELIRTLERLGLAFGADTNAETNLHYTTYKLDLPRVDEETMGTALTIMRETASELTISAEAVERERGIIATEYQSRNVPALRRIADVLEEALPDSHLGDRAVGKAEQVGDLTVDALRGFYDSYYKPERATLVIVGDFDVAEMEERVRQTFSDWQGDVEMREAYVSPLPEGGDPVFANHVDPAGTALVEIARYGPLAPAGNSLAQQREETLLAIASIAISNRINRLAREENADMLGGQVLSQALFGSAQSFGAFAVVRENEWERALATLEREMRRAYEHGFTQAEVDETKAVLDTALSNAVQQASGRPSSALAEGLINSSLSETVFLSPEATLAVYRTMAESLSPEAAAEVFRKRWQGGPTIVHVATQAPIENAETAIAAAYAQSASEAVEPPVQIETAPFAYETFGEASQVVSDTMIEDLGIRTVAFGNGVRLNMKVTDFEPGSVSFLMRVGQGRQAFPGDLPGFADMVDLLMAFDGLEAHDADELRRILAGRQVSLALKTANDALTVTGSTTAADLDLQAKLLAASIVAPGFRPETQVQWAAAAPVLAQTIATNPTQVFIKSFNTVLAGGDTRLGFTDPQAYTQRSVDEIRDIIGAQLEGGAVELGLVGDFDPDAAIEAVRQTLGAIGPRGTDSGEKAAVPLAFVTEPALRIVRHGGGADQGYVSVSWPTTDDSDFESSLTRRLLAAIFQLRLTDVVREELGATYTPEALSYSSDTYEGFGHITGLASATPENMDTIAAAMRRLAGELAAAPVDEDTVLRARQPILESFSRGETSNSSWLGAVAEAQGNPETLDRRRRRTEVLSSITAEDIRAMAERYMTAEAAVEIRVLPAEETAE